MSATIHATARCSCGSVELEAVGEPILSTACFCDDCQEAARRIERLPGAPPVAGPDGGTEFLLYRRDRIQCSKGAGHLTEMRLTDNSKTRRMLAGCCNSAMFLDFAPGHWLTAYRGRFGPEARPIEMRVMTRHALPGSLPEDGIPNHKRHSVSFMVKLLAAWIPMLLRRRAHI